MVNANRNRKSDGGQGGGGVWKRENGGYRGKGRRKGGEREGGVK